MISVLFCCVLDLLGRSMDGMIVKGRIRGSLVLLKLKKKKTVCNSSFQVLNHHHSCMNILQPQLSNDVAADYADTYSATPYSSWR